MNVSTEPIGSAVHSGVFGAHLGVFGSGDHGDPLTGRVPNLRTRQTTTKQTEEVPPGLAGPSFREAINSLPGQNV